MARPKQKNSENTSISDIFLSLQSDLKRFLVHILVRKEDVEDVLQDAYIRAINAEKTMDIAFPKPFLFRVARNLALSEISKKSNKVTSYIEDLESTEFVDNRSCVEHNEAIRQELDEFYEDVLMSLPPQCQKVFILRKAYGFKHKEIAQELDISVSTVEKHLIKGFKRYEAFVQQKQAACANRPEIQKVAELGR